MAMPNLRFKADDGSAFPDWQPLQLSSICSYEKQRAEDGNFVETANMLENFGGVKLEPNKTKRGVVYHPHDVLLSNIRPYLKKAWLSDRQGVCSSDVLVLRPQNVIPYFLFTLIASDKFIKYVMSSVKGSKMPRGNKDTIMKWHILLPSTMEQSKIAAILSAVDDVINKQQAEVAAWELRKKGVVQRLFSQEVRFKADDGSNFPDWETTTVGNLFSVSAGGDLDKNRSTAIQSDSYPFPVYANSLEQNGLFGYASYYKVEGDTFTVTGRGNIGHATARHEKYVPIVRLLVCKPKQGDNVDFFAYQINSINFLEESTGVPQLTAPSLRQIKLKRPCIEEQRKIADCLDAFDEVIAKAKAELELWRELKRGLLQQLFV